MIFNLVRETGLEIEDRGNTRIEMIPTASFKSLEEPFSFCEKKKFAQRGSELNAESIRAIDLSLQKDRMKPFLGIEQLLKLHEKYIIFEQDVKE
ncbi:LA_1064 family peroxide-responsive upregulated protein [Leptospira stimsonii]|uniref:Uncharacterized protein n=1 Tax=Leptospira stimsonii TaxID=2202203 RepID=A0A8B3CQ06_9LEPT|nr:hypothetical protein [Leptospira stimsonii]RHX86048.1 hypothetical protein DLM78_09215 [Leptospira stimsonii]